MSMNRVMLPITVPPEFLASLPLARQPYLQTYSHLFSSLREANRHSRVKRISVAMKWESNSSAAGSNTTKPHHRVRPWMRLSEGTIVES
jgi:hypothetical protein